MDNNLNSTEQEDILKLIMSMLSRLKFLESEVLRLRKIVESL